jgi:hypothetical protein
MFTGKLTEEEMKEEHPAELAQILAGKGQIRPPARVVRQREQVFFPIAFVLTATLGFGLYKFITFEQTAIKTVPRGETAPVFVQITATPLPTPLPSPTPLPGQELQLASWEGGVSDLLANRCGTCHIQGNSGGLSLATYQDVLTGGNSGPAIIPGDPQNSMLVKIQSAGGHPGQLTDQELQKIIQWIEAGAPEQ